MYYYHSFHNSRPLGVIKNNYVHFDNVSKVDERLHPKVQIPLAGFKYVPKQNQVLTDIAQICMGIFGVNPPSII